MSEATTVFVIVDDEQRRHDLETILEFIGEAVIVADPDYWVEPFQHKEEIGLVIVDGDSEQAVDHLNELAAQQEGVPFSSLATRPARAQ